MGDDNAKRRLRTNELSYLSPFERRLNRTLWGLTWLAVLYSIAQHVLLANIPELFPGGARLGDLIYDLAIAYVGAFVFYLLVVRIPLRRDRENVYQHLEPLMTRIVQEADELMGTLHQAAGFESHRPNTLANVIETCAKIEPETPTSQRLVAFSTNPIRPPVRDAVQYHMERPLWQG